MRVFILLVVFLLSFSFASADHPDEHDDHHAEITIEHVEAKIGGSSSKRVDKGETLSKEASPGDKVRVDFELVNEGDLEVENIEVVATVEGLDDGDDWEEDISEFDLKPNRERSLGFSFKIPLEIGDGDYTVFIEAEGRDEEGEVRETFEFNIEVEKNRDELMITRFDLSPSQARCQEQIEINIGILNIGEEDQEGLLSLKNSQLKLNFQETFSLDEGEFDADQKYAKKILFTIPKNAHPGTYTIDASITYDGEKLHTQKQLVVESCVGDKTSSQQTITRVSPPFIDTTARASLQLPPIDKETFFDSSFFIASVIAIQIILGVAGIALLVNVFRN